MKYNIICNTYKSLKKPCLEFCVQVLKESATELLFGGHETTASTATSLIMFLGLNPEVLDKLRHELSDKVMHKSFCEVFMHVILMQCFHYVHQERQGVDLRSLNIETLEQLKYTSCVIKETLRMNPPVPGGFRVALKTFELGVCEQTSLQTKLSNFKIKNCISLLNPFTIPILGLSNSQRLECHLQYL